MVRLRPNTQLQEQVPCNRRSPLKVGASARLTAKRRAGLGNTLMSQRFSTELLPPSDRIDAWQWNAQQICGDCRIQLPNSSFHGSIEVRQVRGLPLTRFSSSPLSFWKWPSDTITAVNRSCIVITQIEGARRYRQSGTEVLLRPGDSTLIDSALPWSSSCASNCVRLYLRVPRWMMENWLRMREIPIAQRISGSSATALFRLSLSLYDEAQWMNGELGSTTLDTYFEILAACIIEDDTPVQHSSELGRRILQFIATHIAEPTLGPVEVASAMGISVRHLHRLFSASGSTLGHHIRARRLEQCRNDLANPRFADKTITEIAFSMGFSDAAHFSHSFRKHFGVSARAFRARTAAKGSNNQHECVGDFLRSEVSKPPYARPN